MAIECELTGGETQYCGYNCAIKFCRLNPNRKLPTAFFKSRRTTHLVESVFQELPETRPQKDQPDQSETNP